MAMLLNPYLTFDGTAREAMEFYKDVFGGELRMNTFGDFGDDGADPDGIMHAMLATGDGITIMASDSPPGAALERGNDLCISLSGADATDGDALRGCWQQLSDGGTVTMPLEMQMWGDEFGMCVDRFGVTWMVNITAQPPAA